MALRQAWKGRAAAEEGADYWGSQQRGNWSGLQAAALHSALSSLTPGSNFSGQLALPGMPVHREAAGQS